MANIGTGSADQCRLHEDQHGAWKLRHSSSIVVQRRSDFNPWLLLRTLCARIICWSMQKEEGGTYRSGHGQKVGEEGCSVIIVHHSAVHAGVEGGSHVGQSGIMHHGEVGCLGLYRTKTGPYQFPRRHHASCQMGTGCFSHVSMLRTDSRCALPVCKRTQTIHAAAFLCAFQSGGGGVCTMQASNMLDLGPP